MKQRKNEFFNERNKGIHRCMVRLPLIHVHSTIKGKKNKITLTTNSDTTCMMRQWKEKTILFFPPRFRILRV